MTGSLSADDGYRLGAIATSYSWATLLGSRIVGVEEAVLLGSDFGESGRDYAWDTVNLSCWVRNDDAIVDSATIMRLHDETGDVPQWPVGVC